MTCDFYNSLARTNHASNSNKVIYKRAFEIWSSSQRITSIFQKSIDKKSNGKGMNQQINYKD